METVREILNSQETADLLRVSRKTIFELVTRDRLPCRKVGREYRFVRETVLAWLQTASRQRPVRSTR